MGLKSGDCLGIDVSFGLSSQAGVNRSARRRPPACVPANWVGGGLSGRAQTRRHVGAVGGENPINMNLQE